VCVCVCVRGTRDNYFLVRAHGRVGGVNSANNTHKRTVCTLHLHSLMSSHHTCVRSFLQKTEDCGIEHGKDRRCKRFAEQDDEAEEWLRGRQCNNSANEGGDNEGTKEDDAAEATVCEPAEGRGGDERTYRPESRYDANECGRVARISKEERYKWHVNDPSNAEDEVHCFVQEKPRVAFKIRGKDSCVTVGGIRLARSRTAMMKVQKYAPDVDAVRSLNRNISLVGIAANGRGQ
jgi:hypothetical protein